MRILPTRFHGMMDYLMALFFIVFPFLFHQHFPGIAMWVSVGMGVLMIANSLLTNYEAGAVPVWSMRVHIGFDVVFGFLFAVSPWLFGVLSHDLWPRVYFVLFGVAEIGSALITRPTPVGGTGSLLRGRRTEQTGGPTLGHS